MLGLNMTKHAVTLVAITVTYHDCFEFQNADIRVDFIIITNFSVKQ